MSESLILFTLLLVLLMVVAFGFTGCSSFGSPPADETPPSAPPSTPPATPPVPYETIVSGTPGFAGHWRLNETGGNIARVKGPLAPDANGTYVFPGITLGRDGAMHPKDASDFASELSGGYVEVPYDARLNPATNLKFTVELWVKPNPAAGGATQVVISSHQLEVAAGRTRGYEIALVRVAGQAQPRVRGRVYSSTAAAPSEVVVDPTGGAADAWRHLVLAYDGVGGAAGKKLTLFVSIAGAAGSFKGEQTGTDYQAVQANKSTLRFGAGHADGGGVADVFTGLIDEVAFYNVALGTPDVDAHFKAF